MQQPTRVVSWAKDSLPDEMRARIPPAVNTVAGDERKAGAAVLFLLSLASWVLSSTVGLMPLAIVSLVIGIYYCIPALMKRRGLRLSPPKQLEDLLTKVDEVICEKIPPQFRCEHCFAFAMHSLPCERQAETETASAAAQARRRANVRGCACCVPSRCCCGTHATTYTCS